MGFDDDHQMVVYVTLILTLSELELLFGHAAWLMFGQTLDFSSKALFTLRESLQIWPTIQVIFWRSQNNPTHFNKKKKRMNLN